MKKPIILCISIVLVVNVVCFSQQQSNKINSNSNEKTEFQTFLKEFKDAISKNDIVKVKSFINFPIICTSMGVEVEKISSDEFGIGEGKYLDKEFLKQLKTIQKISKTQYPQIFYELFSLPNNSILYEISIPGSWHMSYSYLYLTKIDGKILLVGENYGSAD